MIKIEHRLFLTFLLILNIFATSTFWFIYDHLIAVELSKNARVLIDTSFGMFILMLWVLFITIIYYAKNGHALDT